MCMFSGPVRDVSSTAIFARPIAPSSQVLVYSMALAASTEVAMVLPLPVPPESNETAVRFLDLSRYPAFFDDLNRAFPSRSTKAHAGRLLLNASPRPQLVVHQIGCFEASFVPTRHDFARLDRRFRLPDDVWPSLPGYDDWGFAVFKLNPMAGRTAVHPMAFQFPRRNPDQLFFPTVHVHAEQVEPWAISDHRLYCQEIDEERLDRWYWSFHAASRWEQSSATLGTVIDADRAGGIVRPDRPCHRVPITGSYPNVDIVV